MKQVIPLIHTCDRNAGMKLMRTGRAQMVDGVVNNDKAGLFRCAKFILTQSTGF